MGYQKISKGWERAEMQNALPPSEEKLLLKQS